MEEVKNDIVEQKLEEGNKEQALRNEIVAVEKKTLSEVNVGDIEFTIDKSKSYEEQAEDVVGAMATAAAVSDKETADDLAEKKAEELKAKASKKLKAAQTDDINAETDKEEAERVRNEAVLQTFGITKHLPNWLLRIMVVIFSPIYILLTVIIGIPCGVIKVLIENIDNILVRYESTKTTYKPKIRVTVWIIFGIIILGGVSLVVFKCLNKI